MFPYDQLLMKKRTEPNKWSDLQNTIEREDWKLVDLFLQTTFVISLQLFFFSVIRTYVLPENLIFKPDEA